MAADDSQTRLQIDTNPDFIALKRYDNSLEKFLERYPNGVADDEKGTKLIAQALQMTEDEVKATLDRVIRSIRHDMKVKV
jgi:hypothetical protein